MLETEFGHYVGHTARLRQRIDEHIRGDAPATRGSDPRPAWKSRPLTTRNDAQEFEAALKSLREQRSDRFKEITGLEPRPFIRHKPDSDPVKGQRHPKLVETGNGIQTVPVAENFEPKHDNRRSKPLVSNRDNRHYQYRSNHVGRLDMKKVFAWFVVVLVLAVAIGYVLGFRASDPQVDGFANVSIMVGAVALIAVGFTSRVFLQKIFGRLAIWKPLNRPIEGDIRNTLITIAVTGVSAAIAGGLGGYVTGLRTAQSVIGFFRMIGIMVFAAAAIALVTLGIIAYLNSQEPRSRQSRRSRRRRRWRR